MLLTMGLVGEGGDFVEDVEEMKMKFHEREKEK